MLLHTFYNIYPVGFLSAESPAPATPVGEPTRSSSLISISIASIICIVIVDSRHILSLAISTVPTLALSLAPVIGPIRIIPTWVLTLVLTLVLVFSWGSLSLSAPLESASGLSLVRPLLILIIIIALVSCLALRLRLWRPSPSSPVARAIPSIPYRGTLPS